MKIDLFVLQIFQYQNHCQEAGLLGYTAIKAHSSSLENLIKTTT
jgi:hypothetical protein